MSDGWFLILTTNALYGFFLANRERVLNMIFLDKGATLWRKGWRGEKLPKKEKCVLRLRGASNVHL